MEIEYYKYPLDLKRIFQQKKLQKCSLGDAISQNLQLIILSHNGEHRYNHSLGCEIWDLDFDLILSLRIWEEKLRSSLLYAIERNERTLEKVEVSVAVSEVENTFNSNQYVSIKRQVNIQVHAVLIETGEKYYFQTKLFLSPVSAQ
ncbi:GPW/gp25 family protein [uncultured Cytophaga sp.]|uniref:GPW/gp25 family protein n=1 Tax=uncultured Cytophaga sp. TaxID=160238 RepID=UPI00262B4B4E|nr:GPW/gp25 family protein [uncultured Cytophaga sp.]